MASGRLLVKHMSLSEIKKMLNASILTKNDSVIASRINIKKIYCADLMSDVLAFSSSNSLLITGLTNVQVIRTSEIANIDAVVFIQGKMPNRETIALADKKKIFLLATDFSMFDTCGRLYEKGLRCLPDEDSE
jgi:predicted transcriptional regulator